MGVLPVLRGAAGASRGVLKDCREGTKMSFDAMKYDLYNEGVPKTPDYADDASDNWLQRLERPGITSWVESRQWPPALHETQPTRKLIRLQWSHSLWCWTEQHSKTAPARSSERRVA